MQIHGLEEFISQFPVYDYRVISTDVIRFSHAVRIICKQECERYDSTWACPPGVGSLDECQKKCSSYKHGLFFSSVAEVSDILNFQELLDTRKEHEKITNKIGEFLKKQFSDILVLSTESCDICPECTYPNSPCRHPDIMHPCLESHGVVVSQLTEDLDMDYGLGGNTVLWFSLILF